MYRAVPRCCLHTQPGKKVRAPSRHKQFAIEASSESWPLFWLAVKDARLYKRAARSERILSLAWPAQTTAHMKPHANSLNKASPPQRFPQLFRSCPRGASFWGIESSLMRVLFLAVGARPCAEKACASALVVHAHACLCRRRDRCSGFWRERERVEERTIRCSDHSFHLLLSL